MNLMDLFVKISVDDQASSQVETIGSKLKGGLATAAKVGAAAVAAAGTAVVAIGKQAIEQYAEYEQLVGGVETLFKQSADTVMGYAENAYKTAGLSANEYMNTVTSFSASLLQSLGGDTEAAAKYADMAITDMSDNANKMGTSMEMIQNAYQGFAKQNYTMLDNLKLGYGGTKEEMQRLLEDAEKLSGIKYDISSYADIVDAIHVVQTEMGITGTTAKEASTTIQGSLASMKSAWQNLLTGVADENANFEELVENFVESVATVGENIIPRIEQSIMGIGKLLERLSPVIAEKVPEIVSNVLPNVLNAATTLVNGFINSLVSLLPTIVESGGNVLMSLLQGILDSVPNIVDGVTATIDAFVDFITQNLPQIIETGVKVVISLAEGLIKAIPNLAASVPEIVHTVVRTIIGLLPELLDAGVQMVKGVWEGIKSMRQAFYDSVKSFFTGIVDGVKDLLGIHSPSRVFAGIGENMALGLSDGWDSEYNKIRRNITNGLDFGTATIDAKATMSGKLQNALTNIGNIGGDINIVVQSVLDGKIIGETAYKYNSQMQRAMGV